MSRRLPSAASATAPAERPPAHLPGLDPRYSRLVTAAESPSGILREWHLLDNAADLTATPTGTILCVHGNPTWSYLWRALVATGAAAGWRVIAVDQLDMGFSERTGTPRPLARRVRDLGDLTDALELDGPVVTLGHDWGGVVSMGWAVDHPQRLVALSLLNTAIHQPDDAAIPAPLRLALSVLGAGTVSTPAFLETTLALAHPPLSSGVKDAYRAPYRGARRRGGIGGFVADIPIDASHESFAELTRIAESVARLEVPAFLQWGPRDPIFSDRYLDDLIERMPHAEVHRFEGAGHLIAEDVDYARHLLDWLEAVSPAPLIETTPVVEPVETRISTSSINADGSITEEPVVELVETPAYAPLWHNLEMLRDSDDIALVEMAPSHGTGPREVSWRLLSRRVRQLAAGLTRFGVRRGDRVSLLVPPGADLTAVLYACVRIGAIVVVADAGLGIAGLTRAVRGARPDVVIGALPGLTAARSLGWPGRRISVARLPAVTARLLGVERSLGEIIALGADEHLPPEPAPDAVAAVLFTSGSTGPAKGVVYTHAQLSAVRDALQRQYGVGVGTGLVAGFAPFALLGPALGACSATPDMNVTSPRTLTATAVADAAIAVRATVVFLSPAALMNVVATADELTSPQRDALGRVETFLSAGAPVSEHLLTAASALLPNATPHTPYGMTEGLLMTDATLETIREARPSAAGGVCVGMPGATTQVRLSALDADGRATGALSNTPGVTGEIVVSAPHVKDRYDKLAITDRASKNAFGEGLRWHRTGDVGHLDDAGRLWVEGRLPHVITTAAGVVTPVGVEQRIEALALVSRAAAVGIGPAGTQQVVAVVETVPAVTRVALAPVDLATAVREASAVPLAAVLVVPVLPTDIRHNSKIDRTGLGVWAAAILAGGRIRQP